MYRILSLDGGGICGLLTATLLDRIEKSTPGFLGSVNLFAGTSTGGILALGLAAGLTPATLAELYDVQGPVVFEDTVWDNLRDLGNALGAKYNNVNLKRLLEERFAKRTLGNLRQVLVSSFDLDSEKDAPDMPRAWKPKFFHNFPGADSDAAELAVDVALRTSAAPTYFPTYQGYIDGGVAANNPAMCAVAQALRQGVPLDQIVVLSLGCGQTRNFLDLKGKDVDWGYMQWAVPLASFFVAANVGVAHYQCKQVLGERYRRVNPDVAEAISLDDVTKIPVLKSVGQQFDLIPTLGWLEQHWFEPAQTQTVKPKRASQAKAAAAPPKARKRKASPARNRRRR